MNYKNVVLDDRGDESVANPESSRGECVWHPRVKVIPVNIAEALGEGQQVEVFHKIGAQEYGNELVIDNVLKLGIQDAAGFLKTQIFFGTLENTSKTCQISKNEGNNTGFA